MTYGEIAPGLFVESSALAKTLAQSSRQFRRKREPPIRVPQTQTCPAAGYRGEPLRVSSVVSTRRLFINAALSRPPHVDWGAA
jgi:hypothetical protein